VKARLQFLAAMSICFCLLAGALAGGNGPDKAEGKETYKVSKGTLKGEVTFKGIVEAETMTEIVLRPEAWTQGGALVVKKAAALGSTVKKGDTLVELETDKIDRDIRELEAELKLAAVTLKQAEEELPILEKTVPVELADAERANKIADEDLKRFLEVDRPLAEQNAEFSLKMAQFQLEDSKEELKQLLKMYGEKKDQADKTEEMILKQQRNQVENAEFGLKAAKNQHEQSLKVDLPRREQTARETAVKTTLALNQARSTLPLTLNQKCCPWKR